jgi:hypothetical protein
VNLRSPAADAGPGAASRPRLLFLRPATDALPAYIGQHFAEQARCLAQWFDVAVAPPEGDYAALCEAHRPDLVILESGSHLRGARRLTNTQAFPGVPRLGFLNSDAYCPTRRGFLSDMDHWGVETFFTHSVAMAEHTPEIAARLFVWPNFIDPLLYRDYGADKVIPILLTGSREANYPWRNQIMDAVSEKYATLRTPHFGWRSRSKAARTVHGVDYARLINAAVFAPTCGAVGNEVVRKHFEIPGCRTCLVTERTAGLVAAGFVDMDNCVFVGPDDVVDKLDHLLAHPDELQAITDRGHALVHARHTAANRDQIWRWFSLQRSLRPGRRIVQLGAFDDLLAVSGRSDLANAHVHSGGRYCALLDQAAARLQAGDPAGAERLYLRALNYISFAPEPCLGMARCALARGDAAGALQWTNRLLYELDDCQVADPDPVEWACLVIALLCLGRVDEAARQAWRYPGLRHPELARTQAAVAALSGVEAASADPARPPRPSVHRLPGRSDDAWRADLAGLLQACGQRALAERLRRSDPSIPKRAPLAPRAVSAPPRGDQARAPEKLSRRLRRHALRALADPSYPGRFLAAHGKPDDFAELISREAVDGGLTSVLLVARRHWSTSAHALLDGVRRNPALPILLRVGSAGSLDLDRPPSPILALPPPVPAPALREEMTRRGLAAFDLVVIDGSAPPEFDDEDALAGAGVVLIDRLDEQRNHLIARRLLRPKSGFQLMASHPESNGGFAGFRRLQWVDAPDAAIVGRAAPRPALARP